MYPIEEKKFNDNINVDIARTHTYTRAQPHYENVNRLIMSCSESDNSSLLNTTH